MDPHNIPYGEMATKQIRLPLKLFHAYSKSDASRVYASAVENGSAQRNGGTASLTFTLNVMR